MKFLKLNLCQFQREPQGFIAGTEMVFNANSIISITKHTEGYAIIQLADKNTLWQVFQSFDEVVAALSQ